MAQSNQNDVLNALLNTEDTPEKAVPMKRFGVDFSVRAVDIKTIKRLQVQATFPVGKNQQVVDEEYFGALMIAEASVVPNWKEPKLLEKYGTADASEVVRKRLLAGEIAYLVKEVMDVSGFDQDEQIERVKN